MPHDLTLAGREQVEPRHDLGPLCPFPASPGVLLDRLLDALDQTPPVEGFLDESRGAGLHGPHRRGHVPVTGDDDDRGGPLVLADKLLELEAAHARHSYVSEHAAGSLRIVLLQEPLRGSECLHVESGRLEQPADRSPQVRIIVNDEDRGLTFHHRTPRTRREG
jgi:hypothetical protein